MLAEHVKAPLPVSLSVLTHAAAALQFCLTFNELEAPREWLLQGLVLIGLSLLLAFLESTLRRRRAAVMLIAAIRFLLLAVLSYPMGRHGEVEVILLVTIVFDLGLYADFVVAIVASVVVIAATQLLQGEHYAWRAYVPASSLMQRIGLAIFPLFVLTAGVALRSYRLKIAEDRELMAQQKRALIHAVETNLQLQDYVISREDEVAAMERKRITREIHDTVGHTLMSIILMMKAAGKLASGVDPRVRDFLVQTETQARAGMEDTRKALRILRGPEDERPALIASVNRLVKAFRGTFLHVRVEYANIPMSFNPIVDAILFRLVQETITNSIRHGDANDVGIYFWLTEHYVSVTVSDNGRGCSSFTPGIGLSGILERLAQVGGSLEVPVVSEGFSLIARIPWSGKDSHV